MHKSTQLKFKLVSKPLVMSQLEKSPWEPPTDDEWRRAALAIAKQVSLHIAGYRDHKEFAGDGCRFAWDVFDTIHLSSTRRDH